jgi:RND family efflux transporter MFP subunit
VTEGNLINGGTIQSTLLTTIVSLDPIHVYFDADEQAFLKYTRLAMEGKRQSSREVKNPVYFALADERSGYPHKGHMDFVDNRMDPNTGTMRGRAIFRNADLALTPGLFARLRLPGSAPYEAVLAPDSAIGSDQSVKYVLIVDAENKVRRQPVEIGPMSHGLRVVRSGLDGSERIVLRGLQRVRPGMQVTPIVEGIKSNGDNGLPDSYTPVPKEEWIALKGSAA